MKIILLLNFFILVKGKFKMNQLNKYISTTSNIYKPKTINQQKYLKAIENDNTKLVIVNGPAGTGKTLFACISAIELLKNNNIDKIILTRPLVSVEEEIGFLPGNINQKMDPWTKPILDIFSEYYNRLDIEKMIYNNILEIIPLGLMRGRTFKKSYIIADEMQNSTPNQMKMITTRIGEDSKMIITGDLNQSDLKDKNGLDDLITKYETYNNLDEINDLIQIIKLENTDIERSKIVKTIMNIYDSK
jgi:phosphate starvation-inducible PhoH-like protein